MTSLRQIAANRGNAAKSTGPRTQEGKDRSRCNALRHGLTAETVISALEDVEDYSAFEDAVIADYDAQSAVERELVLRLAGLLWRLRRATTIETGLFQIQAEQMSDLPKYRHVALVAAKITCPKSGRSSPLQPVRAQPNHQAPAPFVGGELETRDRCDTTSLTASRSVDFARCFLRLANLSDCALDRLSRYEAALWRQVGQTLLVLDTLDRRKPQERGGLFRMAARRRGSSF
jgi:hypothetical protein